MHPHHAMQNNPDIDVFAMGHDGQRQMDMKEPHHSRSEAFNYMLQHEPNPNEQVAFASDLDGLVRVSNEDLARSRYNMSEPMYSGLRGGHPDPAVEINTEERERERERDEEERRRREDFRLTDGNDTRYLKRSSPKEIYREEQWTDEETLFLIEFSKAASNADKKPQSLLELDKRIRTKYHTLQYFWVTCAQEMRAKLKHRDYTGKRCARKWITLADGFKRALISGSTRFRWTKEMMDLLEDGEVYKQNLIENGSKERDPKVGRHQQSALEQRKMKTKMNHLGEKMEESLMNSPDDTTVVHITPSDGVSSSTPNSELARKQNLLKRHINQAVNAATAKRVRTDEATLDTVLAYMKRSDKRHYELMESMIHEFGLLRQSMLCMIEALVGKTSPSSSSST